jgi:hypothetical protein
MFTGVMSKLKKLKKVIAQRHREGTQEHHYETDQPNEPRMDEGYLIPAHFFLT